MRDYDSHYSHANSVNRRARIGVALIAILVFATIAMTGADDDDDDEPTPVVLAETISAGSVTFPASTTRSPASIAAGGSDDGASSVAPRTTIPEKDETIPETTTTTRLPGTSTSSAPTSTTTLPTTTTTTTTTISPTTTTTTTTTTTIPPTTTTTTTTIPPTTTTTIPQTTTTTTVQPNAWFPLLGATLLCDDGERIIRWTVADPPDDWSDGWQLVIDRDNRGLFAPGTIVTNNGGAAVRSEIVEAGTHSLAVNVHWELIGSGAQDRGFGTFTITRTHDDACG